MKLDRNVRTMWGAVLVVSLVMAGPASAQETTAVSGTVTRSDIGTPEAGATLVVIETGDTTQSDLEGSFTFNLPPGTYTVTAELDGFVPTERSVTVRGQPVSLDIELQPVLGEVIVVTGQRTPRSQIESPVPVDVITAEDITSSSHVETNQVLATVAPSYNATHQAISDGTDHVNPASLRGLGPDQVLVLLNGKRRHPSALLNVNGTFGRGTVGTDLNAIPTCAIKRIEVLRDGAASQYGSDAIAGVVNIHLRDTVGAVELTSLAGITGSGDGGTLKNCANYGFKVRDTGYFNISGEMLLRDKTQRADPYTGQIFPGIEDPAATDAELERRGLTREDFTMVVGQSAAVAGALYFNGEVPITDKLTGYTFGGATRRHGYATGFYRLPFQEDRVDLRIHPNGFLPEINPVLTDWSVSGGVRGRFSGFDSDFSVTHGGNQFHFFIDNSLNASLGATSPTSFDAGGTRIMQTSANADFIKPLTLAAVEDLSVVFGGELRNENFVQFAGEPDSYAAGPELTSDGRPKTPGAQVFPGYPPSVEVDESRQSVSAYAGVESNITDKIQLDVGGRFENYSDFGSTVIGKAAGRYEVVDNVAARAAVSTGFRAPSLHQIYFSSVSTQFVQEGDELVPRQVLTTNNVDPVTRDDFGNPALDEETSLNLSAGFTARPISNLSITADFYRIQIQDRIVFSTQFIAGTCDTAAEGYDPLQCQVSTILADSPSISRAQFFTNAVDTTTNGVDLVVDYGVPLGRGQLGLTATANFTRTTVDALDVPQGVVNAFGEVPEEQVAEVLFNREEESRLEDALPRQRASVGGTYRLGKFTGRLRASYYGSVEFKAIDPANDETFDPRVILDTDLAYQLGDWRVAIGANNLLNTFPEEHEKDVNRSEGRFVYSRRVSQYGINGGFYYLKLDYLY